MSHAENDLLSPILPKAKVIQSHLLVLPSTALFSCPSLPSLPYQITGQNGAEEREYCSSNTSTENQQRGTFGLRIRKHKVGLAFTL